MKLRKKLIIFSILFLFGFGVFFGTFASAGYLVKAAPGDYLYYGLIALEDLETPGGELYDVDIELEYDDDGGGDEYYKLDITFKSYVYSINVEDYNITTSYKKYFNSNTSQDLYFDIANGGSATLDDIETYYDENNDVYIAHFVFYLDVLNNYKGIFYLYVYIRDIYMDGVANSVMELDTDFYFYNFEIYKSSYDKGYALGQDIGYDDGYDDGYNEGREDGYDEGYALGETAGYNDGLDIGYYNGYEVGHYDGYTEGEAYGYTTGLDEGYWYGLDEGLKVSGYKDAYDKGVAKAENTASTWFKGLFDGFQRFFNIQLGGISIGAIILIPLSITFAWFIIRQFRGGGGGD